MVEVEREAGRQLNRPRSWEEDRRQVQKQCRHQNWFCTGGHHVPIFFPQTPEIERAKRMRAKEEENNQGKKILLFILNYQKDEIKMLLFQYCSPDHVYFLVLPQQSSLLGLYGPVLLHLLGNSGKYSPSCHTNTENQRFQQSPQGATRSTTSCGPPTPGQQSTVAGQNVFPARGIRGRLQEAGGHLQHLL